MSLSRPSARIDIDGRALTSAEGALMRLRVELGLARHDAAVAVLWPQSKFSAAKPGAAMKIAVGESGSETDVWSGEVTAVYGAPAGIVIEGLSATVALSRERRSQTYVSQPVGDIIKDLAGSASVDSVEAAGKLAAFSVDTRRSVWAHMVELARLTGANLSSSASGGVRFVPAAAGGAPRKFRYGAEALSWSLAAASGPVTPEIFPHGSASENGASKWHWLLHDPAGGAGGAARVVGAFHDQDAAGALKKALDDGARRRALRGQVVLLGTPDLRPGEVIEIDGLPGGGPGPLHVLEVNHTLDTAAGFVTELSVEGAGAAGGAGLP